jgi:hypothetical protein
MFNNIDTRKVRLSKHLSIPRGKIDGAAHFVGSFNKKACPLKQVGVTLESSVITLGRKEDVLDLEISARS